jgi:predicted HNH restriction endonuclease
VCDFTLESNFSNVAAFEFHHHKGEKDFNIGNVANKSWGSIAKELQKCVLVCSNCHRIEHCTRSESRLIEEYFRYNGKMLGS